MVKAAKLGHSGRPRPTKKQLQRQRKMQMMHDPRKKSQQVKPVVKHLKWSHATLERILTEILDDPTHNITSAYDNQFTTGDSSGKNVVHVPKQTIRDQWAKVALTITMGRKGTKDKEDHTKAVIAIHNISHSSARGKHLMIFKEDEEELLAEVLRCAFSHGFGFDEPALLSLAQEMCPVGAKLVSKKLKQKLIHPTPHTH
jgi:hypothetical protein